VKTIKIIAILLLLLMVGCEKEPEYREPKFQTSEFQTTGSLYSNVRYLLFRKNIDYHNDDWQIQCPKCGQERCPERRHTEYRGAVLYHPRDGDKAVVNFVFAGSEVPPLSSNWPNAIFYNNLWIDNDEKQVYCECLYPLGTDWTVITWEPELRTSEFQWMGEEVGEAYIRALCEENNFTPPDGNDCYYITCPDCGWSHIYESPVNGVYHGFFFQCTDPNKPVTYCSECMYPLGTDWRIKIHYDGGDTVESNNN